MTQKRIDPRFYNRKYFLSDNCEGFNEYRQSSLSFMKKKILDILNPAPHERILDVGCGRGEFLYHCFLRGASVVGIDYAKDAIELSQELFRGLDEQRYDFFCLDIVQDKPKGYFHKIVLGDVIEHMTKEDARKMIHHCFSILEPGGIILVHTSPNTWFMRMVFPFVKPLLKFFGKKEAVKQMERARCITSHCHVNEYSYFSLKKFMKNTRIKNYTVWLGKNVLRGGVSVYTSKIFSSSFIPWIEKIFSLKPLIYFFSNDIFVIIRKL